MPDIDNNAKTVPDIDNNAKTVPDIDINAKTVPDIDINAKTVPDIVVTVRAGAREVEQLTQPHRHLPSDPDQQLSIHLQLIIQRTTHISYCCFKNIV